jgi:UDP-glucose 4-epimerase
MKVQKILVTGGAGFIGSHTAVSLIEHGYEPVLLDNLCNSDKNVLAGIEAITGQKLALHEIDMCDAGALDSFFASCPDISAVIHFAALKAVGESVQRPVLYYQNNLTSLLNLLQCMEKHSVPCLIFSSSATVYGEADVLPIEEHHPVKPALSPYGNTKQICEEIIRDQAAVRAAFHAISLRYFNPIGAHASGEIGELPRGVPNNLMPFITQTAAGLREELLVFGDDYDTPDGTAVRDYIHVVDLAEAHVKALDRLLEKKQSSNYEIFNLGTGIGYSVLEVIHSFEKTSGQKLPYRIVARRAGDVPQLYASTHRANSELGWTAQLHLDEMTASAWNWEQRLRGITKQH